MFERLGHLIAKRKRAVLSLFLLATILAGGIGSQVFSRFDSGGYSDPNSDSAKVWEYSKVRSESSAENVISYWSAGGAPAFKSKDGTSAFIFIYLKSTDFTEIDKLGGEYQKKYDGKFENVEVYASGGAVFANAINGRIQNDLKISEAISIPLTFLLLLFVFGAMAASAMPLIVGITAILGTFLVMYLLTLVTDVSIFALNLTTGLGLGLGIDYALLMVNRFREELAKGLDNESAIVNTLRSAGKTVFYSGLTVVLTLISLTFFPQNFLKSMGYAGAAVVALAVLGALIPLPAILAMMGSRINKGVIRKSAIVQKEDGRWARVARFVMRRPVSVVTASLAILFIMISPITNIKFSQVDSGVLPKTDRAYIASQFIADEFPGQESNPIEIVFPKGATQTDEINSFMSRVAATPGIIRVGQPEITGASARVIAIHSMKPRTSEGEELIHQLRKLPAPDGTIIGGVAADYADTQGAISRTLPAVIGWIMITVLLLLFAFTGSVLLPIKAVILNFTSLAATMGILTWIFIDGNLKFLVGDFIETGSLDTNTMVLIAVVAFGLSMDYEVFLLSRIKEEHDAGKANVDAVALGLQKSARIITAAAFILAVVFAAFVISGVTSIKMMGFGVAFAILLDATLIRAFLVPALMRLFGERNWWAPRSLKRFQINH
ncbi:MAG: MMPL family transporter [Actinobacteria bacterium]|nr:MMPL family transporter [Actinomycetota bacterium]